MDKAENDGLRLEDISIDKKSIKQLSLKEQILKLAQGIKVKRERNNALSLIDELEETSRENEQLSVENIDVGNIIIEKDNLEKGKPENDRGERD